MVEDAMRVHATVAGTVESVSAGTASLPRADQLNQQLAVYMKPDTSKATWQIVNSLVPLFACTTLAWLAWDNYPFVTILLALVCGGLYVRIACIQHDCGHNSFFASRRANDFVGMACTGFTLVPYLWYRRIHL